ncbi:MAG: FG-GAP repeat domain-containing protein, partial [Bacteroidota bacterium]
MNKLQCRTGMIVLIWLALCTGAIAQTFVEVTDPANPIATDTGPEQYSGASWVDFDGDGDLDLFANNALLYRNDGGGTFVTLATNLGAGQPVNLGNGNSWADYDNDGDPDCFIASAPSFLFRNDGVGAFTKITSGAIGDSLGNRGWACAWADYNNDGYVDLAITHPANFVPGTAITNQLLLNNGPPGFSFTRITSSPIVTGLSSYTVGTWSDFDLDGDMDYFIGAGPVSTTAPDFLYKNMLIETGLPDFVRITTGVMATDFQDGQVWNWV